MNLVIMAQNMKFGGRGRDGTEQRWPLLAERITKENPDILMLEEAYRWEDNSHAFLAQAMKDLDLESMPLTPSPEANGTVLLYKQSAVGRWRKWFTECYAQTIKGFGVAAFDVGLRDLLSVCPIHLAPFSQDRAMEEISLISTLASKQSDYVILGGDFNFPPNRGTRVDFSTMKDYNVQARTILRESDDAPMEPDCRVGWKMEQSGYVDVAWEVYKETGNEKLLAKTATDSRIDQFWVTRSLTPAISDYWTTTADDGASDHQGIVMCLDLDRIKR